MFNPLPLLALGAVAFGYVGAIDKTEQQFGEPVSSVAAFPATPDLSVHDFVAGTSQAIQEPHCDVPAQIASTLAKDFAETRRDSWIQGTDMQLDLWASDIMGTWTLVHNGEDGIACIVSSGHGWTEDLTARDVLAATPLAS